MRNNLWKALYQQSQTSLRQIREWFNCSQEEMAHLLGVTFRSYNLWENGEICPGPEIWEKLRVLIVREAKKRFRPEFLRSICEVNGIPLSVTKEGEEGAFRSRTEDELLAVIASRSEVVDYLKNKVFTQKPGALKNKPFQTAFDDYCRGQMGVTPRLLLSLIPSIKRVKQVRSENRRVAHKPNLSVCARTKNNRVGQTRSREPGRQKKKSRNSTSDDGDGDSDPEPPYLAPSIPEEGVDEFIALYKSKYGIEMGRDEAAHRFSELLTLFALILKDGGAP